MLQLHIVLVQIEYENFVETTLGKTQLITVAILLATEHFKVGETGESPKYPSKRAMVTFSDSITASVFEGKPSDEIETFKRKEKFNKKQTFICLHNHE